MTVIFDCLENKLYVFLWIGGGLNFVMHVRARRSIDHPGVPWHLRYVGQPEGMDKNRPTLVRSCIDVATSENLVQFLNEMGFRLDHEFILKGYMFRKGRMKITVSKIFRVRLLIYYRNIFQYC